MLGSQRTLLISVGFIQLWHIIPTMTYILLWTTTWQILEFQNLKSVYWNIDWHCNLSGPGSSVGIVTGYGLDGPGIKSRWGRDFPHLSRPALGPTQPPAQWVPGLSRGKERPGRDADPSPPSSAVGHERVALYLYSPYGPYGLYRASVSVQGWPLPYLLLHFNILF